MRYYLSIFFILTCLAQIAAEDIKSYRIGTSFGASYYGYREETDIPLNRKLAVFNFIVDGNAERNKFLYSFNTGIYVGKNDPVEVLSEDENFTFNQRESTLIRFFLENSFDYKLWGTEKLPGYLGGAFRFDIYYNYLKETIYYSLTGLFSLNIHITQKWIINEKNALALSLSLPFFGYGIRPPFFGLQYSYSDLEKKIISFHNYWAFFTDIKYQYKFSRLLSFYAVLGFEFSHINFPQPRRDACTRLNAGVSFSF